MKRFLCKILLAVAVVGAMLGYSTLRLLRGACSGDVATVYDDNYLIFFTYQPDFPERPTTTTDFRRDAAGVLDSTILVLGDSFTQLGSRSFLTYLQHFMPSRRVLNVKTQCSLITNKWNYVHASLMDGDTLLVFPEAADYVTYLLERSDSLPGVIVLECGERFIPERMSAVRYGLTDSCFQFYSTMSQNLVTSNSQQDIIGGRNIDITSTNPIVRASGILQFVQDNVKGFFGTRERTKRYTGDRPLFSARGDENSIFVHANYVAREATPEMYAKTQENLRQLFALAECRGVQLIFFVCPDKYTVYQPFALEDTPAPTLRQEMKAMEADPHYQSNYDLLDSAIRAGVQDVFISTDTHWSFVAAEMTARALAERIRSLSEE